VSPLFDSWSHRQARKRIEKIQKQANEEAKESEDEASRSLIQEKAEHDKQEIRNEFVSKRSTLSGAAIVGAENGLVYGAIRKWVNRDNGHAIILPHSNKI
jgi:F0F1-type ATP synthase membrane subunit b/b'